MYRFLFFFTTTAAAGASLSWLLDSTIKSIVVVLAAGVAALTALRQASAAARHFLWFLAIAAALALPILSLVLPAWRILPPWSRLRPSGATGPNVSSETHRPAFHHAGSVRPSAVTTPPVGVSPTRLNETASFQSFSAAAWPLLSWVWAAGCGVLLFRLCAAHLFLRRTIARCAPGANDLISDELQFVRKQLGLRQPIILLRDARPAIPFVFGLLRPRLVLPMESEQWSRIEIRSVLLHELAHIKRNDVAIQWLTQIVCAVHWFNPLVWFAAWRLHVERERACDDLVLASGVRAADYAEHLLHVATKLETPFAAYSCGTALAMARPSRPSRLEGRLVALLNGRSNRVGVTRALGVGAAGIAFAVIVPMAMLRAADEKPDSVPQSAPADSESPVVGPAEPREKLDAPTVPAERKDGDTGHAAEEASEAVRREADQEIMKLRAQLEELRKRFTDGHPRVKEVRARIAELEAQRDARHASDPRATPKNAKQSAEEALALLRLEQAQLEYRRAAELHDQKMLSREEYDKAKAMVELRRAELAGDPTEVARIQLAQAEAQLARVSELHRQKMISDSEQQQAKFAVEEARIRLKQRELEATEAKQLDEKRIKTVDKIPVLGDIPILGRLFRKSGSEVAKSEETVDAFAAGAPEAAISSADRPARTSKSEMRVVALKYSDASTVSPLVEKAMAAQKQAVHVLSDARTNSLVIVADQGAIDAAIRFISLLDKPSPDEAFDPLANAKRPEKEPKEVQQALEAQEQVVLATRLRLQQAEAELKRLKELHAAQAGRP